MDAIQEFRRRILERKPLAIQGSGSKAFYGGEIRGEPLDMRSHRGVVSYEPTELVITVRAGTPLAEVEALLAEKRQFLAFEAPHFGAATIGGAVASGLSGPRRATLGSLRDFVLGVRLMDGEGRELRFGGEVMKNVAGYDVSRLIAGSLGTLGLILDVSLKVLPLPVAEVTLRFELPQDKALDAMNRWAGQPLPVAATAWQDGVLSLHLAGAAAAVSAAGTRLGGERLSVEEAAAFWRNLREQRAEFFAGSAPLWRLGVPAVAPPLDLPGAPLIEWGGAQRWLRGDLDAATVRDAAARVGGHATLFRGASAEQRKDGVFTPLPAPLLNVHRRLKLAFDPYGVFNPGRLYPDF